MIEWKLTIDLNLKSKATSCRTYSHDHVQLRLHELFYLEFAEHKLPCLWLWDPTQSFSNTNSPVCDSKTTLESLNHQLCMILYATTLNLPILMVWEWFLVVTLKGEGTVPFRSQKSTSKVITKRALRFPLNKCEIDLKP